MRLLQCSDTGECSLTRAFASDEAIPSYAILSHTWGADFEEVTFDDLTNGTGKDKPGYEKLRFCGKQARQDDLQYFWIDTCCINKANKAELSQAIRSMFRWYRNAARCYVYLSDVSTAKRKVNGQSSKWEPAFRGSRWFTRGWTLQELLAPRSVEFFSRQRKRLGDKYSLRQIIHEITAIPESALQGALFQFSVKDRLSWIEHRQTKLEEDKAYSLLGIFDVYIPPIYGEGIGRAFQRLLDEISKLEKCTQDLHVTDPRCDKARIEETKGGLLEDLYHWILQNPDFQQWRDNSRSRLLWIKGDPGKGKTMLLCGIINELNKSMGKTVLLSYFFCQAMDSRINSATAVLRGLLFLLVKQQPSLVSHIQKYYDHIGKTLFENTNAWVALCDIFTDVIQDLSPNSAYLIIDALDECISDLPKLLDFIVQTSSSSHIKWVISSRNWPSIEECLKRAGSKIRLSLELNAESISAAVRLYIRHKVLLLAQDKKYSDKTKDTVLNYLYSNANNTFLWVALVCQNLEKMSRLNIVTKLKAFPPGLDSLYKRIIQHINNSDDADICRRILALIAVMYRPITLQELTSLEEELEGIAEDLELIREIVSLCGSLLTIRDGIIYFVHQSAKDFLLEKASEDIFASNIGDMHRTIFSRSLQVMSKTLRRDIYGLCAPGFPIDRVNPPNPDPLVAARYSCVYWIHHLREYNLSNDSSNNIQDEGSIDRFLRRHYLHWLEALSLCKGMSEGVASIAKLKALIQGRASTSTLNNLVRDAHRFIMYHKWAIENSPLQVYTSALIFSPKRSVIRGLFKSEEPKWITIKSAVDDEWTACLQTLEGHSGPVWSMAFSPDSTRLASASDDRTVKIWDASSGECVQTLQGHSGPVWSVAFSPDSTRLASASSDNTVKIWDASSGECVQTLQGHSDLVRSVAFSPDSTRLASASGDNTVKIWDTSSGECVQTLQGHSDWVMSVAFSPDSTRLASASDDRTVKIWDTSSGECVQTLQGHSNWARSVAFSPDSTRLASASTDRTVKIWDTSSGECVQKLHVGALVVEISFDTTGRYLHTNIGTIDINASRAISAPVTTKSFIDPQKPQYEREAISSDKTWITFNSENMLRLPSEYRPSSSAVSGNKIGIGVGSGRVWICELKPDAS